MIAKNYNSLYIRLIYCTIFLDFPVSAVNNTILKTSVPYNIELDLEITGKGSVQIGNQKYSTSQTISVLRNERKIVLVCPSIGYQLSAIELNGDDISQRLQNGGFEVDTADQDVTLSVVFVRKSVIFSGINPPTGDIGIRAPLLVCISALVLLPLEKKQKR